MALPVDVWEAPYPAALPPGMGCLCLESLIVHRRPEAFPITGIHSLFSSAPAVPCGIWAADPSSHRVGFHKTSTPTVYQIIPIRQINRDNFKTVCYDFCMTESETNPQVYSVDRIWQAALAALTAANDKELAISLGISEAKLKEWRNEHPSFYRAIVAARQHASNSEAASEAMLKHISSSLSPELRELWDTLNGTDVSAKDAVMYSLATRGDYDRQKLLLHALSVTRFDITRCCTLLGISKTQLDSWAKNDPKFVKLWEEVSFAKKNFIESALMRKIDEGDTRAIIFASKTLNKDRGYGETLEVTGRVEHIHAHIDFDRLDLDVETKSKILLACKRAGLLDLDGMVIEGQVAEPTAGQIAGNLAGPVIP